jgi:CubicO group peptidase (beta-lactamase class C family)
MLKRRVLLSTVAASLAAGKAAAQAESPIARVLATLMQRDRVPGASVAVIRDGAVADRIAIGADPQTLFEAASISKVVTGLAVLRLAEQGRLDLDRPVNQMLRSWTLPGESAARVTPRLLLSHRAGTTVGGFPGYVPGTPLPDLRQILDGLPPANTEAVRVAWPPGAAFRYSGGGTMVLQQLVDDVAGDFDRLARELVLAPVGMGRSGFFQPLPESQTDAATAHDIEGKPLPGRFHVYPEHAAAGLWSTPEELALMAIAIAASWKTGGLLTRETARMMATPVDGGPTGLGIFAKPREGKPAWLYHLGVNAGFRSILVFAADASFGLVLMTNGEGGRALIPAFLKSAFDIEGQDPFRPDWP